MNSKKEKVDILIVDDTIVNLKILVTLLERNGFNVRPVNNGKLALNAVQAAIPDLILLDVRMPEMDGYEVCKRLKANEATRNIPVIFISAQHDNQGKLEAFQAGGADYITKPFQFEEVLIRIEMQLKLKKNCVRENELAIDLANEIEVRKAAEKNLLFYEEQTNEIVKLNQSILDSLGLAEETLSEGDNTDKHFLDARDAIDRISKILKKIREPK